MLVPTCSDGWYYLDVISTLSLWLATLQAALDAAAAGAASGSSGATGSYGCSDSSAPVAVDLHDPPVYSTSIDGDRDFSCVRLSPQCADGSGPNLPPPANETAPPPLVVRCMFDGGHEVHAMMPRIAWEFFSREPSGSCSNDDYCLQQTWGASSYHCETSVEYCSGSSGDDADYARDMAECCPAEW